MPKENVLGEVGKGYKIAIETLNEGRIGIGAQMIGLARGAWEYAVQVRAGAQAVRQGHRRIPGHPVPDRADGHRDRSRPPDGLQLRSHERRRHELRERSRHDQAIRSQVAERVTSLAIEIYGGYGFTKDYPGGKILARCQDRQDLRGHLQYAARDDRQAGACQVRSRDRLAVP